MINKLAEMKTTQVMMFGFNCCYLLYNSKLEKAQSIVKDLQVNNTDNDMFASAQKAMDRNNDVKTYGARLASIPAEEQKNDS